MEEQAAQSIAEQYDPEFDPMADLWDYVQGWVLAPCCDGPTPENEYQDGLRYCGLSKSPAEAHMDSELKGMRKMRDP